MFQVHCTEDVIAETLRCYRTRYPSADGRMTVAIGDAIRENVDEVLPDFQGDVPYAGTDPHDRHLHAAAVACGADVLLTADQRAGLDHESHPYTVFYPDDFFLPIDDSASPAVRRVTNEQNRYWESRRRPGQSGIVGALQRANCPIFATRIVNHLRALSA